MRCTIKCYSSTKSINDLYLYDRAHDNIQKDIEDSIRLSIDSTGPFRLDDRRLIATSDFFAIERKIYQMNIEAQDSAGHKSPVTFEVWFQDFFIIHFRCTISSLPVHHRPTSDPSRFIISHFLFISLSYIYIIGKCSYSKPARCCIFRRVFNPF